ncbi:MAG: lipocalin-like domain-containing protein [Blastocatellia bacterium]|nr:lipocalin-like domain-containing protein [Blastocatellia bacterium]
MTAAQTSRKRLFRTLVLVGLLLAGGLSFAAYGSLSGEDHWRRALPPYSFQFNRDHASHPEYKVEWWYYTGNVKAEDGRRFGYQLTFFRVGVDNKPVNPSRWAVRDLFMTHLAVSELDAGRFRNAERINRAGVGWAGAETERYRVWNEDWAAEQLGSGNHRLQALDAEIGLDLELLEGKSPVVHGARGVSQKGDTPGNASHYYSLTRMPTRGALVIDGQRISVEGESWMDHEFGTSFLEKGQMGWDWLSIQLEDGTDLMLYQFRRTDGARDPHSHATLIQPDGAVVPLSPDQFALEPGKTWRSATSGAAYPIAWRVSIPGRQIELTVRAALDDQELRTSQSTGVNYWEGAIDVAGTHQARPVRGRGYLEMTGYAGAAMGVLSQ